MIVGTLSNISAETSFTSNSKETYVSFEEIQKAAKLLEEEKEKRYSGNVVLGCKAGKDEFYGYEDVKVYCDAKNTGNVFLENIDACFETKCKKIDLGISQIKNVTFDINKSIIGSRESPVVLRNGLVSKSSYVSFKINDAPKIEIEDLNFPINVSYEENFTVSFELAKKSNSIPKNVEIVFVQNGIEKRWVIDEMKENRKFELNFIGSQLKYGRNSYKIKIEYYDGLGKKYNIDKEFLIELANATLFQRLLLWMNGFLKG